MKPNTLSGYSKKEDSPILTIPIAESSGYTKKAVTEREIEVLTPKVETMPAVPPPVDGRTELIGLALAAGSLVVSLIALFGRDGERK